MKGEPMKRCLEARWDKVHPTAIYPSKNLPWLAGMLGYFPVKLRNTRVSGVESDDFP